MQPGASPPGQPCPRGTAIWAAPGTICRQHLAACRPAAALPAPETCPRNPLQLLATFPATSSGKGNSGGLSGSATAGLSPVHSPEHVPCPYHLLLPWRRRFWLPKPWPRAETELQPIWGWLTGHHCPGVAGPGLASPRGSAGRRVPGLLQHPDIPGTGPNGTGCALESQAARLR